MKPTAIAVLGLTLLPLIGCASKSGVTPGQQIPAAPNLGVHRELPGVIQGGPKPISWVQIASSQILSGDGIVVGPDKNIWFHGNNGLAQMTMTGSTTVFPVTCFGNFLTVGADGNFYSTCGSSMVAQVTPNGVEHDYPIPSGDSTYSNGITTGPDGNVWFTEGAHVGVITPSGHITEYLYPSGLNGNTNDGITAGSDGNIWFTEEQGRHVDRVTPGGTITQFNGCLGAEAIVSAADRNLYLDCPGSITQMSTNGTITGGAPQPWGYQGNVQDLTIGPDEAVWFVSNNDNVIGEYNFVTQTVNAYIPPSSFSNSYAITAGPDGNIWATANGKMNVYVIRVLTTSPKSLTFSSSGQMLPIKVTETGTTHWTAQTSNSAVASVVQGTNSRTFEVTANEPGTCHITISDAVGNLVSIHVKVY